MRKRLDEVEEKIDIVENEDIDLNSDSSSLEEDDDKIRFPKLWPLSWCHHSALANVAHWQTSYLVLEHSALLFVERNLSTISVAFSPPNLSKMLKKFRNSAAVKFFKQLAASRLSSNLLIPLQVLLSKLDMSPNPVAKCDLQSSISLLALLV